MIMRWNNDQKYSLELIYEIKNIWNNDQKYSLELIYEWNNVWSCIYDME